MKIITIGIITIGVTLITSCIATGIALIVYVKVI